MLANAYEQYHAHIYFDADTVDQSHLLCKQAGEQFPLTVGRVHEKNVGPHPRWSCQLAFAQTEFDRLIPWLEQNRDGLTVFVHGLTGDDLADHTDHVGWLGDAIPLNLSVFSGEHD